MASIEKKKKSEKVKTDLSFLLSARFFHLQPKKIKLSQLINRLISDGCI